jgi:hypothetical protein
MLRNYDRHLAPVRRYRRLCHGGADPAGSLPSAPPPATGPEVELPVAANAGFKEALAARPVSLVVPTSLSGKVARVELHNDSLAQITSQHTLPRRAG